MKLKTTIAQLSIALLLCKCLLTPVDGRPLVYCNPIFNGGCTGVNPWYNQSITLNSLNWTLGSTDCLLNDYTGMSATLNAGVSTPMTVVNGVWCGCSVWIDLNQDQVFDSSENFYHSYIGGDPSYTYNFNITIPTNVPTGSYRMRVVAGWGTDCYSSSSSNGYGPCGTYTYGNFDDFMVDVVNVLGIDNPGSGQQSLFEVSPNPATSLVTVTVKYEKGNDANLVLTDITGKVIRTIAVTNAKEVIDISDLAKGVYMIRYNSGSALQSIRLIK